MNRLFPQMNIPERLALEFFGTFARCEYALKGSGFAKGSARKVEADWDTFARSIDRSFQRVKDDVFVAAVDFLLSEPPRKQVLKDGQVRWKVSPPDQKLPRAEQVLLMVRRVRNNLFHGAKVWSPEYGDRVRDIRLIRSSLTVIRHCIEMDRRVQMGYEVGTF